MKTIEDFSKNYGVLYDAVVKSVSLSYNSNPYAAIISVDLECMSIVNNDEWVNLSISFYDIDEFKISSNYYYGINSIENFCFSVMEDKVVFDFIPCIICPATMEEHRKSLFYVSFKSIDFKETKLE